MPRKYVKKKEDSTPDADHLLNAIKEIRIEKNTVQSVSTARKIPKSSLFRYLKKIDKEFPDISKATDEEILQTICSITAHDGKPVC